MKRIAIAILTLALAAPAALGQCANCQHSNVRRQVVFVQQQQQPAVQVEKQVQKEKVATPREAMPRANEEDVEVAPAPAVVQPRVSTRVVRERIAQPPKAVTQNVTRQVTRLVPVTENVTEQRTVLVAQPDIIREHRITVQESEEVVESLAPAVEQRVLVAQPAVAVQQREVLVQEAAVAVAPTVAVAPVVNVLAVRRGLFPLFRNRSVVRTRSVARGRGW